MICSLECAVNVRKLEVSLGESDVSIRKFKVWLSELVS